jgi:hypothetical protein
MHAGALACTPHSKLCWHQPASQRRTRRGQRSPSQQARVQGPAHHGAVSELTARTVPRLHECTEEHRRAAAHASPEQPGEQSSACPAPSSATRMRVGAPPARARAPARAHGRARAGGRRPRPARAPAARATRPRPRPRAARPSATAAPCTRRPPCRWSRPSSRTARPSATCRPGQGQGVVALTRGAPRRAAFLPQRAAQAPCGRTRQPSPAARPPAAAAGRGAAAQPAAPGSAPVGPCACGALIGFPRGAAAACPPAPPSAAYRAQRVEPRRPRVAGPPQRLRGAAAATRKTAGWAPRARAVHPLHACHPQDTRTGAAGQRAGAAWRLTWLCSL